ncbi:hypothetical protein Dimus_019810 [Dionaea muscipula]
MMKGYVFVAAVLLIFVILSSSVSSRHVVRPPLAGVKANEGDHKTRLYVEKRADSIRQARARARGPRARGPRRGPDTLLIAGSSLPDCSHACGSCRPCRLVMVSFVCASLEEAETCPMAYKCMCKNKSYPVP